MSEVKTNKKTYIVTIEVSIDPSEVSEPSRWNYGYLLGKDAPSVEARLVETYEACCEAKREWATADPETRYGDSFQPEWHDEACANYVPIDDPEEDEDEDDTVLLETVFGGENPVEAFDSIVASLHGGK